MKRAVYLHVGMKKTGTSYLQSTLRASNDELRRQALDLVPHHEPAGHRLARAVLGRQTAGDPLTALSRQLAAAPGDRCLITQELLGRAGPRQIERMIPALADHEVHVVVTVRDVARTIPSAWQQYVKAGRSYRYDEFLDAVLSGRGTKPAKNFWLDHGVVDMARRWGRLTTPPFTHVVVVPPHGAPTQRLLERFCSVIRVDPTDLVHEQARSNESLGLAQVEVLRRLNEIPRNYAPKVYGKVYKRGFAHGVLSAQPGRRPLMPASSQQWCREYTDHVVEALENDGYDVVGDLDDLHPPDSAFTDDSQQVSDIECADAAIAALRGVLDQRAREVEHSRTARRRHRPPDG